MIPVLTIVGRPNVGKSTLFNRLTKSRQALVDDQPGVTRDRQYGHGKIGDRPYIIVDTGGLAETNDEQMAALTDAQVHQAIEEADCLLFMVEAKTGLTTADENIAKTLRPYHQKVILLVNKSDRIEENQAIADFFSLGFSQPKAISATSGRGVEEFIGEVLQRFPQQEVTDQQASGIHVAVLGRPNVGKSTLINRILGEERVITFDRPGTTRDSVFIPFERGEQTYTLIDTAGVRRRSKVDQKIELFSIIKTMQAIQYAHVVIVVFDMHEGLTDQDLKLIGKVLEYGKAVILAFNKWDGLSEYDREQAKAKIERKLVFVEFARRYFISALHGTGVGDLFRAINEAYALASKDIPTSQLTEALQKAVKMHSPPLSKGRRIKLRYAHVGGHHPLLIVVHGKQTDKLSDAYKRYLANHFRKTFKLISIPVIFKFKNDDNPYDN